MTDLMILTERLKTADELLLAATCYRHLEASLPKCKTDEGRARVQAALDELKDEIRHLGERMLQFEASGLVEQSRPS